MQQPYLLEVPLLALPPGNASLRVRLFSPTLVDNLFRIESVVSFFSIHEGIYGAPAPRYVPTFVVGNFGVPRCAHLFIDFAEACSCGTSLAASFAASSQKLRFYSPPYFSFLQPHRSTIMNDLPSPKIEMF